MAHPSASAHETIEIEVVPQPSALLLEVQDDEEARRVPLGERRLVVGTARNAGLAIRDPTVSARHCELAARDGGVVVRDLGSRNGTYVGGARILEAWCTVGMTILVGRTSIAVMAPLEESHEPLGPPLAGVAGGSSVMCRVASQVRRLARLTAPVLIAGETGAGKELVARALHAEGLRGDGPFVALNVAALPRELVESELFGHERGAFTGAVMKREGAFAEAEGGTLFLDEIGELPMEAQPKLLRALDGYEVRRVGSAGSGQRLDARVVAATHVRLSDQVDRGRFRRDLFHRLEVFVVELPPLRVRPGDILPIARLLLQQLEPELGFRQLTTAAIAELTRYDWPGNVRELRNVLCRAADFAQGNRWIDTMAVLRALRKVSPHLSVVSGPARLTRPEALEWVARHGGNVSAAARAAKVPRTTLRKLLRRGGG